MSEDWRQYVTPALKSEARSAVSTYGEYAMVCVMPPLEDAKC